jgi:hypothetical protein
MKIGLVGMQGSGKTTVFNALTGLSAETGPGAARGKSNVGVVKVPDERVEALARHFKPKKKTLAEITFSDVAAGMGGGSRVPDRGVLNAMREVDALCQVVCAFDDGTIPGGPTPEKDVADLETEMILADLEIVERRLERLKKEKGKPREDALLGTIREHLEAGKSLRSLTLAEDEWAIFSGFRFLTQKPMMLVLNVDESAVAKPPPEGMVRVAKERGLGLCLLSAKVEQDIAQMEGADQADFIASLGLDGSARDRFVKATFALVDLISFLTSGEDECRAWPIKRGTVAQKAAGKVHSDIERGFIRAEVMKLEDLVKLGSEARCREAGKLHLEGKEYVVQDGDVINYRFNV